MNKKVLLSLILIGVLAIGAGMGTYAWFTSEVTSENNVFETGTLKLELGEETQAFKYTLDEDGKGGIFPSWTSEVKTINVDNTGSLDFKYRMSVEELTGNILYDGDTPLQVKVGNGEFTNINALGDVELGEIAAKSTGTFDIQFKLPGTADNTYQGANATFTFKFDATQVKNNTWAE